MAYSPIIQKKKSENIGNTAPNSPLHSKVQNRANPSVLDNKETFLQFSSIDKGSHQQKNSFITTHYRIKNLELANVLELSLMADDTEVNKVIRSIRYCSSFSIIEKDQNQTGKIFSSSKSCKSPHCAICARSRSTRLATRLYKAINDKSNTNLFKNKYFYFLTLTVKHTAEIRKGIYLKEFNDYCNKLFRSALWKNHFPTSKKDPRSGWIHTRECTLTGTGYHIHSHTIICCDRLNTKITEVEKMIRKKWLKITGDSTGVRLDTVKARRKSSTKSQAGIHKDELFKTVKELFKYGTKVGNIGRYGEKESTKYAEWIKASKGKNFVNVSGVFRGLNITGAKSKYDSEFEKKEIDLKAKYAIGKTSKLKFNHSTKRKYHKSTRSKMLADIHLKKADESFIDVTNVIEEMREYMKVGLNKDEIETLLPSWVEYIQKKISETEPTGSLSKSQIENIKGNVDGMIKQFKLFEIEKTTGNSGFNTSNF